MVQYEPDYSPQAWERLKKQIPAPESRLKKLLWKFRLNFFVVTVTGVLIIVYMITSLVPVDENSVTDPLDSDSENNLLFGTPEEPEYSEKTVIRQVDLNIGNKYEKESKTSDTSTEQITDSFQATDNNNAQTGGAVEEKRKEIKSDFIAPVMIGVTSFFYGENLTGLIPVASQDEDIQLGKDKTYDNKRKLKFNWPDFNLLFLNDEGYDRFVGPNKLAIFYSPEIHSSDSLKAFGVSQGVGISFEGPIRSLLSISAGLTYQSIDFHKTLFFEKVPPHLVLQPSDTTRIFYYLDSIGIRSGRYKFLELPITVNFKFIESDRSQIQLSAGISSIAFLQQKYTYETIMEGVSKSSIVSVKEWRNIHPLASLNFGFLYTYNISDRYLWQSSLLYKHHLTPLGANSMNLNRLNFQIGLVYHFGRQK